MALKNYEEILTKIFKAEKAVRHYDEESKNKNYNVSIRNEAKKYKKEYQKYLKELNIHKTQIKKSL